MTHDTAIAAATETGSTGMTESLDIATRFAGPPGTGR